jgi:hypothetical protein
VEAITYHRRQPPSVCASGDGDHLWWTGGVDGEEGFVLSLFIKMA